MRRQQSGEWATATIEDILQVVITILITQRYFGVDGSHRWFKDLFELLFSLVNLNLNILLNKMEILLVLSTDQLLPVEFPLQGCLVST